MYDGRKKKKKKEPMNVFFPVSPVFLARFIKSTTTRKKARTEKKEKK